MCTVSYLPLAYGGCIITSNRDETPKRNASEIRRKSTDGVTVLYPVDPGAGGSWIAIADHGRVGCLLNGAFEPITPDPKYTHSRGHILLDAMTNPADHLFDQDALQRTSPFTLVIADSGDLDEWIWDGDALHHTALDPGQPSFWSSVTLYPEEVREWRKSLFEKWLATHEEYVQKDIMKFHRYGSADDNWNGFVMNREERVRTLSITSVTCKGGLWSVRHEDLLSESTWAEELPVRSQDVETD